MKKWKMDPKYTKIAVYVFATIGGLMILWKLLTASSNLWQTLGGGLGFLWHAVSTVVAGLVLGYILSPAVRSIERLLRKIFKKKTQAKALRRMHNASIAVVYLLIIALVVVSLSFVVPGLTRNVVELAEDMPGYVDDVVTWYENNLQNSDILNSEYAQDVLGQAEQNLTSRANEIVVSLVTGIFTSLFSVVTAIFNTMIALAVSFYYLMNNRDLAKGMGAFYRARFGESRTVQMRAFLRSVDRVFGQYISAKVIQIVMIFAASQIIFILLQVKLSTLMALVVALTNVIPYIGPIIGMIPPIIIALLEDPMKAVWVLAAMMALQGVDGYVIQPNLIGDKLGLSPFWVIVVVLVGGRLFGLVGILLSVPVAAVIRILILQYIKGRKKAERVSAAVKD